MKNAESVVTPVARFAEELKAWRERRGWTQVELGEKIGYSGSQVSSVENQDRLPAAPFAKACDEAFETPGTFERLHKDIALAAHPPWFSPYVHYEEKATRIHCWDNRSITGLLQTEDYAREIIRAGHPDFSDEKLAQETTARIQRQEIMRRESGAPYCWFIIHESALRTMFGGKRVMRDQMDLLLEAARSPHVLIQVFPFSVSACPGADGAVTIFDFDGEPSVGYAEGYQAGRTIEAPREVASLVLMFDHLRALALSPGDSVRLISEIRGIYDE